MNEFKALKVKHLTTVSDRRAVMPRYEVEKQMKMKRANSTVLTKGVKSAKTMQLRKVTLKDIYASAEAMHGAGSDVDTQNRLMLAGRNKPVHGLPQSQARLAAHRPHIEIMKSSYCSRQSCRESTDQTKTKTKANPLFRVRTAGGGDMSPNDKSTSANYAMFRNADLPNGACLNDDDNDQAGDVGGSKVRIDPGANQFYQVPDPNFSPKFIITGPATRGTSTQASRTGNQVTLSQQLFQVPDFNKKEEESSDEKPKSKARG